MSAKPDPRLAELVELRDSTDDDELRVIIEHELMLTHDDSPSEQKAIHFEGTSPVIVSLPSFENEGSDKCLCMMPVCNGSMPSNTADSVIAITDTPCARPDNSFR